MRGVFVWGAVILLNSIVMLILNRRRLRRRESASHESTIAAAGISTLLVHGGIALTGGAGELMMWLAFTVITVGGASLVTCWMLMILSRRWSKRA